MMLKIFIFILISLFFVLYFINRNNQENFQESTTTANTTPSTTTTANITPSITTTQVSDSNIDVDSGFIEQSAIRLDNRTTQAIPTTSVEGLQTTRVVELDEYDTNTLIGNSIDESIDMGTNYNNFFQGGFCKLQQKLGYDVGCSGHIYDDAFFNIDRELNSVKQNYSILKS